VNPYDSSAAIVAATVAESGANALPAGPPRPRRVWTVFLAVVVALFATIAAQIVGVIVLVVVEFSRGTTPQELQAKVQELVTDPITFMVLGALSQAALIAVAMAAAYLSPVPLAERLGFVRPNWTLATAIVAILGAIVPFAVGMGLAHAILPWFPADPTVAGLYENMTPVLAVPWVLFIALAPGLCEETLFRGYMQRRLIERWPAGVAILVTSLVFAVFHIMPPVVLFAFPVGIWLGIMAWKSGSVWPGVICHATINGAWNIYQVGAHLGAFPEELPLGALIAGGVIGTAAFAGALVVMFRRRGEAFTPGAVG
jgi:membrane protease YdiL (CAAX protease family)